eukprot:7962479-Alexandrium_andersonii.AAC.1
MCIRDRDKSVGGSCARLGSATSCATRQWVRTNARKLCRFLGTGAHTAQVQQGHCQATAWPCCGTPARA